MLNGNIFVSHCLCFILCADKYLIQCIADIKLSVSTRHLHLFLKCLNCSVFKIFKLNIHLGDQFCKQTIFLM